MASWLRRSKPAWLGLAEANTRTFDLLNPARRSACTTRQMVSRIAARCAAAQGGTELYEPVELPTEDGTSYSGAGAGDGRHVGAARLQPSAGRQAGPFRSESHRHPMKMDHARQSARFLCRGGTRDRHRRACAGKIRRSDLRAARSGAQPLRRRCLRAKGAIFIEELDEVPDGATLIFSAHGVPQAVRHAADRPRLQVFDATCPLVTKVHVEVSQDARTNSRSS
jgi:hypothetical protein